MSNRSISRRPCAPVSADRSSVASSRPGHIGLAPPHDVLPDPIAAGRLGKYQVHRRLARGGMADILLGSIEDSSPHERRPVVLKRILPEFARRNAFVSMFVDEVRLAGTLRHPSIVQVFDVGFAAGTWFMAMEHLHGEDVRAIRRAEPDHRLPIDSALHIAIALCAGLHYAHERVAEDGQPLHIVHRDVSPQNVVVTYDGVVKLLDFGIAKSARRVTETGAGERKGKLSYMSPEQCLGDEIDRRTDVYSLGVMLYEMTVGRRPYRSRREFDLMRDIVEGRITPPRRVDSAYPADLEAVVLRALSKDRAQRFQTACEMQAMLEACAERARLDVSQARMAAYMQTLFAARIAAWHEARKQGRSLVEHLSTMVAREGNEGTSSFAASVRAPARPRPERDRNATPYELPAVRVVTPDSPLLRNAPPSNAITRSAVGAVPPSPATAGSKAARPIWVQRHNVRPLPHAIPAAADRPRRSRMVATVAVCAILAGVTALAVVLRPRSTTSTRLAAPVRSQQQP